DPDRAALRRKMDAPRHVLEDDSIDLDAAVIQWHQAGDGAQEGGLTRAVRPQQGNDLAGGGRDRDVEIECAEPYRDLRLQHHNARTQRSPTAARTGTET